MKYLVLALLLIVAGCKTPAPVARLIPPPPVPPGAVEKKLSMQPRFFVARQATEPAVVAAMAIMLPFTDCAPQIEGTYYRCYRKDTLNGPWYLYAETTNHYFIVTNTGDMGFFKFSSVFQAMNGEHETFGADCP